MENQNSSYSVQIGKTTFIVCVKQSKLPKSRLKRCSRICADTKLQGLPCGQPDEFRKITENLLTKSSPKEPATVRAHVLPSSLTCRS